MKARKRPQETDVVTGVVPERRSRAQVARRFLDLLDGGARLRPAGVARDDPALLLTTPRLPRHEIRLFDTTFFVSNLRFNEALGFVIAYVAPGDRATGRVRNVYPRIFYKDSSLVWRVASHFVHDHSEYWIGKGDVRVEHRADGEYLTTAEETTNLPYEMQAAMDDVSRRARRLRDNRAIELVLREGPAGRIEPYADFSRPRLLAAARHRVNGGRRVARFSRKGDPTSLRFARGFAPDFETGVIDESVSVSSFFGGALRKIRILSENRQIQYLFMCSPTHAWINPPQTLTRELSTYGVRTLEVLADDALFIPGYEYHEAGDSQIPDGFAGAPHPKDPHRSDASAWLEALPVIQEFRRRVLARSAEFRALVGRRPSVAAARALHYAVRTTHGEETQMRSLIALALLITLATPALADDVTLEIETKRKVAATTIPGMPGGVPGQPAKQQVRTQWFKVKEGGGKLAMSAPSDDDPTGKDSTALFDGKQLIILDHVTREFDVMNKEEMQRLADEIKSRMGGMGGGMPGGVPGGMPGGAGGSPEDIEKSIKKLEETLAGLPQGMPGNTRKMLETQLARLKAMRGSAGGDDKPDDKPRPFTVTNEGRETFEGRSLVKWSVKDGDLLRKRIYTAPPGEGGAADKAFAGLKACAKFMTELRATMPPGIPHRQPGLGDEIAHIDNTPLITFVYGPDGREVIEEVRVTKATEGPIPAADFEKPEDYKRREQGAIGGGRNRGGGGFPR